MSENVDESGGNTIKFKTEIKDLSALMGSL